MLLLFPALNRGGLSGYDDAQYSHQAQEMIRTGDWWSIHHNDRFNFEHTPLFMWAEALSFEVFGENDFAAKFPAALCGLGAGIALYFLTLELTADSWLAALAMFLLGSTQYFMKYAAHAMTDVPFTFLFTLALLFYAKGLRKPWYFVCAGLAVAASVLLRSIIGVLPLVVMGAHLVATRRFKALVSPQWLAGVAASLLPPLIWIGSMRQIHGEPFIRTHLAFISNKVSTSGWQPSLHLLDYFVILGKYSWPWLPLAVAGMFFAIRTLRQQRSDADSLPLVWFAVVFVSMSLAGTKYARYMIPLFPAMAMFSATAVNRLVPANCRTLCFRIGCAILALVGVYTIVFPAQERGRDMRAIAPVASREIQPAQRILLYTFGATGYDYQNQLLWYSKRHTELFTDLREFERRMTAGENAVGVIDRKAFEQLRTAEGAPKLKVLAESEGFVCVKNQG